MDISKLVSRLFGDIRKGEGLNVVLLALSLFIAMAGYYVIKTVREPLILQSGGADIKSYSSAAQAISLALVFIPLYGWLTKTVARKTLNYILVGFFLVCTELFYIAAQLEVPHLGVIFYVWVGVFSLSIVSQFWSYANDVFSKDTGERLFPLIAIGATLGSPVGSKIAAVLFEAGWSAYSMLHLTAGMLVLHGILYWVLGNRLEDETPDDPGPQKEPGAIIEGFRLVFKNPYLLLIAGVLILLNLVNTTGEFILGSYVIEAAANAPDVLAATTEEEVDAAKEAFIGAFYGNFFSVVNVAAFLLQTFLASRLVKYFGLRGVLFALPIVALGAYGLIAAGAGLVIVRWAKTAENSTDYSIMNTAKAMMWLPTTREEKYAGKQTVDTLFVRFGDVLSAGFVYLGTEILVLSKEGFAAINIVFIVAWIFLAFLVWKRYEKMTAAMDGETA